MHSLFISSPLQTEFFFVHLKIREGGKNKMEVKYFFYFHSDFWKNRVGSPRTRKQKNYALTLFGKVFIHKRQ